MKRLRNIYPRIYDYENLYEAYRQARKGKRFRDEALRFSANLEANLIEIQNELIYHTYQVGGYREFFVHEPKQRLVMALPFKDRVVHWAIVRVIEPWLDRRLIYDTYACRRGKGTHRAVLRLQKWMRKLSATGQRVYCLRLDVSKYFYRIDHNRLLEALRRHIGCEETMQLLEVIIRSESDGFGVGLGDHQFIGGRLHGLGIPIGNLTSQLFANLYLNELDQYAKHDLQLRYYARYMDDVVVLSTDKDELRQALRSIRAFLSDELLLDCNRKTEIRLAAGAEFCGYRIWPGRIRVKKASVRRMQKRLRYLRRRFAEGQIDAARVTAAVVSYAGHLIHCDGEGLKRNLFRGVRLQRHLDRNRR